MRRISTLVPILALCLSAGGSLAADSWTDQTPGRTDRAFFAVTSDGRTAQIGCFSRASNVRFMLQGAGAPLPAAARRDGAVMLWITLPDGRTGRYPVDVEYLGGGEDALVGTWAVSDLVLDFFAGGSRFEVTDPGGATLFSAGMAGTSSARARIRSICGL